MFPLLKSKSAFTLIEIVLAMTVFAIIMTSVLLAVQSLTVTRVKTENRVKLLEELYFFSEQLITNIKEGGTIDYEEYWNRKSFNTTVSSGSYLEPSGVGNYGSGGIISTLGNYGDALYYCISTGSSMVGTGGCLTGKNNLGQTGGTNNNVNYSGTYQRYGQYILQFTDYNSNADTDYGDQDGNRNILDDEDDKDIGNGPIVLSGAIPELYLINPIEKTRIYFRHIIRQDPGTTIMCSISSTGVTNEGCMGNVQVLKMRGMDLGYTHSGSASDGSAFDGKTDTWILHEQWTGTGPLANGLRIATGYKSEWVDLFPNSVNIKSLKFYIYPKKDPWLSWNAVDCLSTDTTCISPFIHPYVRLQMTVGFSWGKRRVLKNEDPTISINTTVTLSDRD